MPLEINHKILKVKSSPFHKEVKLIKINNLKKLQKKGKIKFNIPGYSKKFYGYATYVEADDGNYKWRGDLREQNGNHIGTILLIKSNNEIYGKINIEDRKYIIQHLGESLDKKEKITLLIETDTEIQSEYRCPGVESAVEETTDDREIDTYRDGCCNHVARILVLYTDAAVATGLNPSQLANMGIQDLNFVTGNSDLATSDVSFELAGVVKLDGFDESNNINGDLNELKNMMNNPPYSNYQTQYQADLFVLYTDGNYPGFNGWAFINTNANANEAYAIVEIESSSNQVFVHEVGHLFGCRHEDDSAFYSERAYEFQNQSINFKTIMHQFPSGTIDHFSNPDVDYLGFDTGIINSRDNAEKILENACDVSDFYPNSDLYVHISGPSYIYNTSSYFTWCPLTTGCYGTEISFSWSYSSDGWNYYNFSSGTCGSKSGNSFPADPTIFIKVVATSSSGAIAERIKPVTNWSYNYIRNEEVASRSQNTEFDADIDVVKNHVEILQNPASNTLKIKYFHLNSESIKMDLINMQGHIMQEKYVTFFGEGIREESMAIDRLPSGYYLLRITGNTLNEVRKIIIQN